VQLRGCPATVTGERPPQQNGHGPSGREGRGEVDPGVRKPAYPRFESEDARTLEGVSTITLVLGGARSGKSELAEGLAATFPPPVTYVATAILDAERPDQDFAARIEAHRRRRPAAWDTIEAGPGLVEALGAIEGSAIVDALGTWVASTPEFAVDVAGLCAALLARTAPTVVVSEEVGLGVHPSTEAGGTFRDVLGSVNRAVADVAGEVMFVIAGRVLRLGPAAVPPAGEEG
jgi:adenosyl cobinamide kinase/adenosyl cobinamide phosphate guanylyltransferase